MKKNHRKMGIICILCLFILFFLCIGIYFLYRNNMIPHKKYTNADFGISQYESPYDKDDDGIDDQTDILQNAYSYISTKPKYKSKYYSETGYPNDQYGVCTDVVAFSMRNAGYDLMELVNQDICLHPKEYGINEPDEKIDFRRVKNLQIYFKRYAMELTTDIYDIDQWQGGDIVIFRGHIGIVSDHRNKNGVSFVIHHANPIQRFYEEDILEYRDDIVRHYRVIPQ